ncbi:MAG: CoA ester lyase [Haloarculaceae archaeon]
MARRSILFSPGDKPDLMQKAPATGADVVVFDLEDAVSPGKKATAREAVNEVLHDIDPHCEVVVRLNPTGTAAAEDLDVILAGDPRLDAVMLPKVAEAVEVTDLRALLAEHDATLPVFALLETAAGILHAESIAAARGTAAVCFGAEDLAADVGADRTREGIEVLHARQQVVLAAAAAGVDAIDTLVTDFRDDDRLVEDAARSRRFGFDGKLAIHPSQVPIVNEAFTPAESDVEWARRVLAAAEEAGEEAAVLEVDGEMIDAPLLARAERIADRADRAPQD